MKSKLLILALILIVGVSVYLTYERTIVHKDFETFSSEEATDEEGATDEMGDSAPSDGSAIQDSTTTDSTNIDAGS